MPIKRWFFIRRGKKLRTWFKHKDIRLVQILAYKKRKKKKQLVFSYEKRKMKKKRRKKGWYLVRKKTDRYLLCKQTVIKTLWPRAKKIFKKKNTSSCYNDNGTNMLNLNA